MEHIGPMTSSWCF